MNLLCRLWGHRYDPVGAEFYCVYHCMRCGHDDYQRGVREWIDAKIWRMTEWLKREWLGWSEWWKCTECGGRFGRHDDKFDHLPF